MHNFNNKIERMLGLTCSVWLQKHASFYGSVHFPSFFGTRKTETEPEIRFLKKYRPKPSVLGCVWLFWFHGQPYLNTYLMTFGPCFLFS